MKYYFDNSEFLANFSDGSLIEPESNKNSLWVIFTSAIVGAVTIFIIYEIIRKEKEHPNLISDSKNDIENKNVNIKI